MSKVERVENPELLEALLELAEQGYDVDEVPVNEAASMTLLVTRHLGGRYTLVRSGGPGAEEPYLVSGSPGLDELVDDYVGWGDGPWWDRLDDGIELVDQAERELRSLALDLRSLGLDPLADKFQGPLNLIGEALVKFGRAQSRPE